METARTCLFWFSLFIGIICLNWFQLLTPKMENIEVVRPNLEAERVAPSSIVMKDYNPDDGGLFWVKFDTRASHLPSWLNLKKFRLRSLSCINSLTTNEISWGLPASPDQRCNNERGLPLVSKTDVLSRATTWNLTGDSFGGSFGFYLDKDWSAPQLLFGLVLLALAIAGMLWAKLPEQQDRWKIPVIGVFIIGFLLRFWTTQIAMPPEMFLFSDMAAYFHRGVQMMKGSFDVGQTFQPIGYTVYGLALRLLGNWELHKWVSIFVSMGTVLFAYLLVLKNFGRTAAFLTLTFVAMDVPQIGFTARYMAESPYSFLIMATLWWIMKSLETNRLRDYFIVGLLLMLSFYFKGNHAFFIPAFSLWLLYHERSHLKLAIMKVTMMALGCFVVMTPHLIFTKVAYQKMQWGPTAGALNLVEGKCPSKNNADSTGSSWMSPLFVTLNETTYKKWDRPFTDQSYFWKAGADCVRENPWVMLESLRFVNYLFYGNSTWPISGSKIGFMYDIWAPVFEWGLLPLALLGALAYARRRNDYAEVGALLILTIFFTVYIFKSENRFRAPFDGVILMWSSLGILYCWEKAKALATYLRPLPART